jgi:hypothetical protein
MPDVRCSTGPRTKDQMCQTLVIIGLLSLINRLIITVVNQDWTMAEVGQINRPILTKYLSVMLPGQSHCLLPANATSRLL